MGKFAFDLFYDFFSVNFRLGLHNVLARVKVKSFNLGRNQATLPCLIPELVEQGIVVFPFHVAFDD